MYFFGLAHEAQTEFIQRWQHIGICHTFLNIAKTKIKVIHLEYFLIYERNIPNLQKIVIKSKN